MCCLWMQAFYLRVSCFLKTKSAVINIESWNSKTIKTYYYTQIILNLYLFGIIIITNEIKTKKFRKNHN